GAEAAPSAEGWGAEPAASPSWDQTAETPASDTPLWADDAPQAEQEETPAQDWSASDTGWGAESETPAPADAGGEQLPMDAIIGTAETQEAPVWGAEDQPEEHEETPAAEEHAPSTEEFAAPPEEAVADVAH